MPPSSLDQRQESRLMSNATRKEPTRPGPWLGREFLGTGKGLGEPLAYNIVARADDGALMVSIPPHLDNPEVYEWFAPIPGPAVLAALAEYRVALAAIRPGEPVEDDKWTEANRALGALNAAILAERDGAA